GGVGQADAQGAAEESYAVAGGGYAGAVGGGGTAAASAVSLHAQARQLAEHGGDRNRDHGLAMHRTTHRYGGVVTSRGEAVAAETERCRPRPRMEIHTPRCGPQTMP